MPTTDAIKGNTWKGGDGHLYKTDRESLIDRSDVMLRRYNDRNKLLDAVMGYYEDVGVKEPEPNSASDLYTVIVPDAQSAIDLMSDLVAGQRAGISLIAPTEKVSDKKKANTIEKWLRTYMENTEKNEDLNIKRELTQDVAKRGACVSRLVIDTHRLPDKKTKAEEETDFYGEFPLVWEVRDWRNVMPVYRRHKVYEVFEAYDVYVMDAKLDWPDIEFPTTWKDDEVVTMWEYWDDEVNAFWIRGRPFAGSSWHETDSKKGALWLREAKPHKMGCLPYSIRLLRGESKYRGDPARLSPGFLQQWSGTLDIINYLESARLTGVLQYTNAAWALYTGRDNLKLDLTPGATNKLLPDEKVEPLVKPRAPTDLDDNVTAWGSRFQRMSIPDAVYGQGVSGEMAGYAISLLSESGRRVLVPVTEAVERNIEDSLQICVKVVKTFLGPLFKSRKKKLTVSARKQDDEGNYYMDVASMDYKDVGKYTQVDVNLGNVMPQDDERAVNLSIAMRQPDPATGRPLASDETIHEKVLKWDDPGQERRRIDMQQFRSMLFQQVSNDLMEEMGVPGQEEEGPPPEMMIMQQIGPVLEQIMGRLEGLEQMIQAAPQEILNAPIPIPAPIPTGPGETAPGLVPGPGDVPVDALDAPGVTVPAPIPEDGGTTPIAPI